MNTHTLKTLYAFTGTLEFEIFIHLLLTYFDHPCATDADYRNDTLERVAEILKNSLNGQQYILGLSSSDMNLIAAVWYSETLLSEDAGLLDALTRSGICEWGNRLKRTFPSCFVASDSLP